LEVSTAQWRKVDLQAQLQATRLDAVGRDYDKAGAETGVIAGHQLSTSVFSVVYFNIDVARREQAIANTSSGRRKNKFPLYAASGRADGDIHYC
jgi:hypothetical protein